MSKTKTPWGKSVGARNLLGAAAPEFEAKRKVTWKRTKSGVPPIACSSCGWAKGVGHDRWCKFVARRESRCLTT